MISINDLQIKNKNISKAGLLFRGVFNYNLFSKKNHDQTNYLISLVNNYQINLKIFNRIINETLLV